MKFITGLLIIFSSMQSFAGEWVPVHLGSDASCDLNEPGYMHGGGMESTFVKGSFKLRYTQNDGQYLGVVMTDYNVAKARLINCNMVLRLAHERGTSTVQFNLRTGEMTL